jgi:hypothetical protein
MASKAGRLIACVSRIRLLHLVSNRKKPSIREERGTEEMYRSNSKVEIGATNDETYGKSRIFNGEGLRR